MFSGVCLGKKPFVVEQWFRSGIQPIPEFKSFDNDYDDLCPEVPKEALKNRFPTFLSSKRINRKIVTHEISKGFAPQLFLKSGWTGDSLLSKEGARFAKIIDYVHKDVYQLLVKGSQFNKSRKQNIYSEFMAYARSINYHSNEVDNLTKFWDQITNTLKPIPEIKKFVEIYCYRVATISLCKTRFIKYISTRANFTLSEKSIYYPNSFLTQVFRKGTKSELQCQSLESNIFNWYSPNERTYSFFKEWINMSDSIQLTEIFKIISPRVQNTNTQNNVYSHALSQINFGLFLNSLLINMPLWMETLNDETPSHLRTDDDLEIISCKYRGDYLESLALSHWLAQENNKSMRWDQVLCPDFKDNVFETGLFMKIFNELQFLSFLADYAKSQKMDPVSHICRVIGGHLKNRKNLSEVQSFPGMQSFDAPFFNSTYNRVILNVCNYPKNNPHHYLINQILDQSQSVKDQGYLIVFGDKNLFINSQKERLEKILKVFEVKSIIDLEQLEGKGELGNYIYILRKKDHVPHRNVDLKQNCFCFRLKGAIENFNYFGDISEGLRQFYLAHLEDAPSLFQSEISDQLKLEFYQDAIINGHLIHSANEDTARITHPRFFKELMDSCLSMDSVFDLKSINPSKYLETDMQHDLNLKLTRDISYFMMVDFREVSEVKLTLHPIESLRSVYNHSGSAQCYYFMLNPKHRGVNINLLRRYFESRVGQQILNLTFNASETKIKSQLSKILIPKFFIEYHSLTETLDAYLSTLNLSREDILSSHPDGLKQKFELFENHFRPMIYSAPSQVLTSLINFYRTLDTTTDGQKKGHFGNPLIIEAIAKLKTYPLLPSHNDIFVEFSEGFTNSMLDLELSDVKIKSDFEDGIQNHYIELRHGDHCLVKFYSEKMMLDFIKFILTPAAGHPISLVIKGLYLPKLDELELAINNNEDLFHVFNELKEKTFNLIEEGFRLPLLSRPN